VRLLSYYLVFLLFVNLLGYLRAVVCVGHRFHFSPPTSSFPPPSPLFPSVYEKLTSIITVQYRSNVQNTRNYYGFLNTTHSRIIRLHILCKILFKCKFYKIIYTYLCLLYIHSVCFTLYFTIVSTALLCVSGLVVVEQKFLPSEIGAPRPHGPHGQ